MVGVELMSVEFVEECMHCYELQMSFWFLLTMWALTGIALVISIERRRRMKKRLDSLENEIEGIYGEE